MTDLQVNLGRGYAIHIGAGLLSRAGEFFDLQRRVFIMTERGVPREYSEKIRALSKDGFIFTLPGGEKTKSIRYFEKSLKMLSRLGYTRADAVVAVGGGVIGDLAGFVASSYMRGIDFCNIPTTTLSQLDSSIGGKTAVNLGKIKNTVGAFYQPSCVIIDTDTLNTLSARQYASGLSEAVKMAMTSNRELFSYFEENEINEENIEYVITESLKIKRAVVEADEREGGVRRILNFGHTYGHAIESLFGMKKYTHGESVALGMIPMCEENARKRLIAVLRRLGLPTSLTVDFRKIEKLMTHDKKVSGDFVSAVFVSEIGSAEVRKIAISELSEHIKRSIGEGESGK